MAGRSAACECLSRGRGRRLPAPSPKTRKPPAFQSRGLPEHKASLANSRPGTLPTGKLSACVLTIKDTAAREASSTRLGSLTAMKPDPDIYMPLALVLQDLRSDAKLAVNQSALDEWTHRRLSSAVLDGKIPAERINARWYVKRADLLKIAELL